MPSVFCLADSVLTCQIAGAAGSVGSEPEHLPLTPLVSAAGLRPAAGGRQAAANEGGLQRGADGGM